MFNWLFPFGTKPKSKTPKILRRLPNGVCVVAGYVEEYTWDPDERVVTPQLHPAKAERLKQNIRERLNRKDQPIPFPELRVRHPLWMWEVTDVKVMHH